MLIFQGAVKVSGIHTDFVFTEFSDRWFIILSQFEKLGTLVSIIVLTWQVDSAYYHCILPIISRPY